jgi:hypothetical protein
LDIFANFSFGKERIIHLDSKSYDLYGSSSETLQDGVKQQVEINGLNKARYDQLLDRIRVSFHSKLSKL